MDEQFINYDFDPDNESSYFGDPFSDQNPNNAQVWDDLIDLDITPYDNTSQNQAYESPSWFNSTFGGLSDFASNTWDSISSLFTQTVQQSQANASDRKSVV